MVCVLLDVALHLVTSEYSTMPENPCYSTVAKSLGVEVTAFFGRYSHSPALLMSISSSDVRFQVKVSKGAAIRLAIALLWLFAMLEG